MPIEDDFLLTWRKYQLLEETSNYVNKLFLIYFLQRNWTLGPDNCYHFNAAEETCAAAAGVFPSSELAEQTIEYAKHLEMIV